VRSFSPLPFFYGACLLLSLLACGGGQSSVSTPPPTNSYLAQIGTPAVAIGVAGGQAARHQEVSGLRIQGRPEMASLTDLWHLGSDVKAMTASLAAVLVEHGQLSWTTKVKDVFPNLTGTLSVYDAVTLEQLLSHRAGTLPMENQSDWLALPAFTGTLPEQRVEFTQWLLQQSPVAPPGTTYVYSNGGYVLAAAMIEQVLGQAWEQAIFDKLLTPLGLHAKIGWPGQADTHQPWGHLWSGSQWIPNDPSDPANAFPPILNPAGNLSMTLGDFLTWAQINLRGLQGVDCAVLTASSIQKLHTPVGTPLNQPGYALGWGHGLDAQGNPVSVHLGSAGTFDAYIVVDAPKDRAVVIIANGDNPSTVQAINSLALNLLK
jgi:CubicO group peptidase (beta-lactamase class C family)